MIGAPRTFDEDLEYALMLRYLGGDPIGTRAINSLWRAGSQSMGHLDQKSAAVDPEGFRDWLLGLPQVGVAAVDRIEIGLERFREDGCPGFTGFQHRLMWTQCHLEAETGALEAVADDAGEPAGLTSGDLNALLKALDKK